MIMIKVSDYAGQHVIDQGAGIWAGMSGSPVYVDGKLLGAVAYGFTSSAIADRWRDAGRGHAGRSRADHDAGEGQGANSGRPTR